MRSFDVFGENVGEKQLKKADISLYIRDKVKNCVKIVKL